MRRLPALISILLVCLTAIGSLALASTVQAAVTRLPVVLLVQGTYYVTDGDGCRVDLDDQKQVLLKVNSLDGKRRGGAWFGMGDVVSTTGPSGIFQTYCGFVKNAEIETTGKVELYLHGVYMLTIDLDEYQTDSHLVIEVGRERFDSSAFVAPEEVVAMGLEPVKSVEAATSGDNAEVGSNSDDTVVTRTTRQEPTEITVAPPLDSLVRSGRTDGPTGSPSTGASSRTTAGSSENTGIITGEWELEEPPFVNMLFVSITADDEGIGMIGLELIDAEDIEDLVEVPVLSEDPALTGCRAFTIEGPFGMLMHLGMCADGEYLLMVIGTDEEIVGSIMEDFTNGQPFTIPPGYIEFEETSRLVPGIWSAVRQWNETPAYLFTTISV